jgi:hypothetical protein
MLYRIDDLEGLEYEEGEKVRGDLNSNYNVK